MKENYQQMSLWDLIYPRKIIDKPIRLIELFSGIGAQHKALKQLTDQVESWKTCEWAYNSYCSYNAIHIKDFTDYSQNLSKEELIEKVRGTSTNYNEPLTDKQLKQKPIEWLRNAYNNIKATHNLINIMEVHGKDLEIVDTDKYEYIMTYSFPCQDLSLAGKRQGMGVSQKDGGTRSGLLWEVERILGEIAGGGLQLPQILVMENVPEVIGSANLGDFTKWEHRLEELGYKNYVEILNAKNYGIPQNRRRCFMVSILGDYNYTFPKHIPLKLKLKDMLEDNVDEKYYLSDKMASFFIYNEEKQKEKGNGFRFNVTDGNVVAKTITTRAGSRMDDNFIGDKELYKRTMAEELCDELIEQDPDTLGIAVKNNTKQGYLMAYPGDGVYTNTSTKRGTVQKEIIQTLTTFQDKGVVMNDLRVRKLTPKECWRLMGFDDEDFEKAKDVPTSNTQLYKQAGNSIVVNVLEKIFKNLF